MSNSVSDNVLLRLISLEERVESRASKHDLFAVRDQIMGTLDQFLVRNSEIETEVVALRSGYSRLSSRITKLETLNHE